MSDLVPADAAPAVYFVRASINGTVTEQGTGDTVPTGAIAVTKEQYETMTAMAPLQCRIVDGVLTVLPLPTPAPATLEAIRAAALVTIDTLAEQARMQFLTPGAGQMMEYQATANEAAKLLALPDPSVGRDADFPWLSAEKQALHLVGVEVSLVAVATTVNQVMSGWAAAGSAIKLTRRGAKLRVYAASNTGVIHDILAGLVWPAPPG